MLPRTTQSCQNTSKAPQSILMCSGCDVGALTLFCLPGFDQDQNDFSWWETWWGDASLLANPLLCPFPSKTPSPPLGTPQASTAHLFCISKCHITRTGLPFMFPTPLASEKPCHHSPFWCHITCEQPHTASHPVFGCYTICETLPHVFSVPCHMRAGSHPVMGTSSCPPTANIPNWLSTHHSQLATPNSGPVLTLWPTWPQSWSQLHNNHLSLIPTLQQLPNQH